MGKKRVPRLNSLEWLDWRFPTEDSARQLFERLVWPDGPHCPHCGSAEAWRFRDKGRISRPGLYECGNCAGQFTVTTKTPMHATKLPLKVWLRAIYLILFSSKGVSSVILGQQLGVRQSTAGVPKNLLARCCRMTISPSCGATASRSSNIPDPCR
ncbi:transposase [Nitratireductor sp. StC3]|uniref:transposase n=1 Tax=Nitratireductor sp. StC3 TaxID=2126741 RepID=UPI000D0D545D|nr:transposase [Nitratireductor sp. StC3]PSM16284.1 hypothetical protein C7T96_20790 [Nitratireductor sp. StC3]